MAGWTKNILIVNGDAAEIFRIHSTLKFEGYFVREASSCDEAMAIIDADDAPAAVLIDLDNVGPCAADGLTILNRIAELPVERQPSVLVLSDRANRAKAIEAVRHGAADFLEKPWTDTDLHQSLRATLTGPQPKRAHIPQSGSELLQIIRRDLAKQHYEHARRIFEESSDTVGGEAAYFNLLGVLAEAEGKHQGARAFYRKAAVWGGPFAAAAKHNIARLDEIEETGQTRQEIRLGDEADGAQPAAAPAAPARRSGLLAKLFGK